MPIFAHYVKLRLLWVARNPSAACHQRPKAGPLGSSGTRRRATSETWTVSNRRFLPRRTVGQRDCWKVDAMLVSPGLGVVGPNQCSRGGPGLDRGSICAFLLPNEAAPTAPSRVCRIGERRLCRVSGMPTSLRVGRARFPQARFRGVCGRRAVLRVDYTAKWYRCCGLSRI